MRVSASFWARASAAAPSFSLTLTCKVTAAAVGEQSRLEGQGEADRVLAVGAANAQATKLAVDAVSNARFRSFRRRPCRSAR